METGTDSRGRSGPACHAAARTGRPAAVSAIRSATAVLELAVLESAVLGCAILASVARGLAAWALLSALGAVPASAAPLQTPTAPATTAPSPERTTPARSRSGKTPPPPRPPPAAAPCDPGPARTMPGLTVDGEDLVAPDGTRYVLAGLALGPAPSAQRQARLAALLAGTAPTVVSTAARPDRWGRLPALVAVPGAPWPEGMAGRLVAEGLALARPAGLPASCRRGLLAREPAPGKAGDGGPTAALQAEDPAAILAFEGRFAVVEGRIRSIGRRTARLYLNFGTIWREDFTVIVGNRFLRNLEASGMTNTTLEGRRVRVRGVVAQSGGPLIEVTTPWDIERLD